MKFTANEAGELATNFRNIAIELDTYLNKNWNTLSKVQRKKIEDFISNLLMLSNLLRTQAVGIILNEAKLSYQNLKKSTQKAKQAVKKLNRVRNIIKIVEKAIGLAGAIISRDFSAIGKNAFGLLKESANLLEEEKKQTA